MSAAQNVTIGAVAAEAGVSQSTASRALNGRYAVASATRARVLAAGDRLGWVKPTPQPIPQTKG